jgi:hypothetical protein
VIRPNVRKRHARNAPLSIVSTPYWDNCRHASALCGNFSLDPVDIDTRSPSDGPEGRLSFRRPDMPGIARRHAKAMRRAFRHCASYLRGVILSREPRKMIVGEAFGLASLLAMMALAWANSRNAGAARVTSF